MDRLFDKWTSQKLRFWRNAPFKIDGHEKGNVSPGKLYCSCDSLLLCPDYHWLHLFNHKRELNEFDARSPLNPSIFTIWVGILNPLVFPNLELTISFKIRKLKRILTHYYHHHFDYLWRVLVFHYLLAWYSRTEQIQLNFRVSSDFIWNIVQLPRNLQS